MRADLDAGYHPPSSDAPNAMSTAKFSTDWFTLLWVATSRQLLLLKMEAALVRNRLIQVCLALVWRGLVLSTLCCGFLKTGVLGLRFRV